MADLERHQGRMRKRTIVLGVLLALAAAFVVLNWTWGRMPAAQPPPGGRWAQVEDVRVHYREQPGSGPAVILLHGQPGSAQDFERVAPLLAGEHTVAVDRPGYGFSDGGYHAMSEQVAALAGLMDQLAIRRAVLVGHSYGGSVALAFAAAHPDRVRSLVLIDAAAGGTRTKAFERMQATFMQGLSLPVVQQIADATFWQATRKLVAEQGAAAAFDPDPVDPAYERHLLGVTLQHDDLDAFAGEVHATNDALAQIDRELPSIEAPAVVIQGRDDQLVEPRYGRRIAARLPHARLQMVSGGHMAPYVHPALVAAAVHACMDGCAAR